MEMYLQHYFDPDFDYQQLRPESSADEEGDRYNLGYVQNAVKGQILAEFVPVDTIENPVPRFVLDPPNFPQGANTRIDPDHPTLLLADCNGYVFYYQGRIAVKHLLNVRSDVDFHTGNIFFVGDAVIHKDVKAGFSVQANNVLIKGLVEGGEIRSRKDMKVDGGARGGSGNTCLLDAGGGLRVTFAEKVEMRSHDKLLIDRFCLHSSIYASGDVIINESLTGGVCQATRHVFVKGNLGNRTGLPTVISLGYDPHKTRQMQQLEKRLEMLTARISHYQAVVGHLPPDANDLTRKLVAAQKKRQMLLGMLGSLKSFQRKEENSVESCRLIVAGAVFPGVEVNIGRYSRTITDLLTNVYFRLTGEEIEDKPLPNKIKSFINR